MNVLPPSSRSESNSCACCFIVSYIFGFLFDHVGGSVIFRKVGKLLSDYTASHPAGSTQHNHGCKNIKFKNGIYTDQNYFHSKKVKHVVRRLLKIINTKCFVLQSTSVTNKGEVHEPVTCSARATVTPANKKTDTAHLGSHLFHNLC